MPEGALSMSDGALSLPEGVRIDSAIKVEGLLIKAE